LADTLASELGILSFARPVLVTQPWKTVPAGTNGGVSAFGFLWSAVGGLVIGASTILLDHLSGLSLRGGGGGGVYQEQYQYQYPMMILLYATTCGLLGSLIDSLLGATVQQTYWDPDSKLVYPADHNNNNNTTTTPLSSSSSSSSSTTKTTKLTLVTESADILNNEQVNMVSVALTTILGGWVLGPFFFGQ
jgi:uncharacterized membrane protein